MSFEGSSFKNNALDALIQKAPRHVLSAIQKASAKTGVDFAYLVEKAGTESAFDPKAKAKTSTATGLFQFIEKTWMSMVKNHGAKYGLSDYASQIDGNGHVKNAKTRQDILNLRKAPEIASYMAAEFATENEAYLSRTVGGDIGPTELYLAHFMGAGGASAFLNQKNKNPSAIAADLFPKEAMANRGVFYDAKTGKPKTLGQIYDGFDHKFTDSVLNSETTQVAQNNRAAETSDANMFKAYKVSAYRYVMPPVASASPVQLLDDSVVSALTTMDAEKSIFPSSLYGRAPMAQMTMLLLQDRYND